jgi:hypothetical protein
MFTLIKREFEDNIAYFLGAAIVSVTLSVSFISAVYNYAPNELPIYSVGLSIPLVVVLIIGFPAMGATQMYTDRTRRISAFLLGLPATRARLFAARIIVGILAILIALLPLIVTATVLWRLRMPPIPIFAGLIFDISVTAFLMAFACYCLGLQTGWTSSRLTPTLGGLALTFVLIPVILVKGFGLPVAVMLILFIAASLVRAWQKFTSTGL